MVQRPSSAPLRLWGEESDSPPPDWRWVEEQLRDAGTYWVVARPARYPHPRPVWGVWSVDTLLVSLGSPVLARELACDPRATVHLDSGTDVVIVEGDASVVTAPEAIADFTARYNAKYDWEYEAERDGFPTRIDPSTILSWRAAGEAGRGGFPQAARWSFPH